ncbi:hypothetical protein PHSY_000411 [Pseudozyma hubeiensis SY62]|uniref:Uncharacterized protein n=1 Tax=Pseudozyma hubeiensis (strain SY62) TaxID=1305764 RepID=R9NWG2_PSEHS|nr:hypothetical protein PHSY_000411 [Pseudozyma hubeiensis SY62]GAC92854.1 hypothetical protein PHSY_000411 [Pseudozyma hubeiensis SY62]
MRRKRSICLSCNAPETRADAAQADQRLGEDYDDRRGCWPEPSLQRCLVGLRSRFAPIEAGAREKTNAATKLLTVRRKSRSKSYALSRWKRKCVATVEGQAVERKYRRSRE